MAAQAQPAPTSVDREACGTSKFESPRGLSMTARIDSVCIRNCQARAAWQRVQRRAIQPRVSSLKRTVARRSRSRLGCIHARQLSGPGWGGKWHSFIKVASSRERARERDRERETHLAERERERDASGRSRSTCTAKAWIPKLLAHNAPWAGRSARRSRGRSRILERQFCGVRCMALLPDQPQSCRNDR